MPSPSDFETWWQANRKRLLDADEEYQKTLESCKLKSGADWLLFAIPVVVAIVVLDWSPFKGEFLNWALGALAAIAAFVGCVAFKAHTSGYRSLGDIEADVKRKSQEEFEKQK